MKVSVVMVRVNTKPEYRHGEQRLLDSYLKFDAGHPHDLVIIDRCGDSPDDVEFAKHVRYDSGGWDCGAWLWASRNIQSELLFCFNSSTYVTGDGWLKKFVDAVEANGKGLYGPLSSYEIIPHIRTPCFVFDPDSMSQYPKECEDRESTYRCEVFGWPDGTPNFTQFVRLKGLQTRLVTWDGSYDLPDWRKPPNIFRRGDQSNLIVKDRHCEAYEASDAEGKTKLEGLANG